MLEIIIRRGRTYWEWKERDEADSRFRTTKIPTRPACNRPASCKWCSGVEGPGGVIMIMPAVVDTDGLHVIHKITPSQASHLVAIEWCKSHPNQPIRCGWVLTTEELQAGKTGQVWPEDI